MVKHTPRPRRGLSPELDAFLAAHPGRDLDRSGLNLHYLDEGQGEPVVMVHGNPTWSFYYRRLVERLSPVYRTVVPDHIGCGYSDKPDDARYAYTLASRVDDLEALLDDLGIDRNVTLVMHDWGGMIGMTYAARHPERIARLVVMNTAAFHMPRAKSLPWALGVCRDTPIGSWLVRGLNAFARGTAVIGCTRKRLPAPCARPMWLPTIPGQTGSRSTGLFRTSRCGPETALMTWFPGSRTGSSNLRRCRF